MAEDISEAIKGMINAEANNNPAPTLSTITKVYDDGKHINAELNNGETIEYVLTIGNPVKNEEAIIIFLDGDSDNPIAIAK